MGLKLEPFCKILAVCTPQRKNPTMHCNVCEQGKISWVAKKTMTKRAVLKLMEPVLDILFCVNTGKASKKKLLKSGVDPPPPSGQENVNIFDFDFRL